MRSEIFRMYTTCRVLLAQPYPSVERARAAARRHLAESDPDLSPLLARAVEKSLQEGRKAPADLLCSRFDLPFTERDFRRAKKEYCRTLLFSLLSEAGRAA